MSISPADVALKLRATPRGQLKYNSHQSSMPRSSGDVSSTMSHNYPVQTIVKEVSDEIQALKNDTIWDVACKFAAMASLNCGSPDKEEEDHNRVVERKTPVTKVIPKMPCMSVHVPSVRLVDLQLVTEEKERRKKVLERALNLQVDVQKRNKSLYQQSEAKLMAKVRERKLKYDQELKEFEMLAKVVQEKEMTEVRERMKLAQEKADQARLILDRSLEQEKTQKRKAKVQIALANLKTLINFAQSELQRGMKLKSVNIDEFDKTTNSARNLLEKVTSSNEQGMTDDFCEALIVQVVAFKQEVEDFQIQVDSAQVQEEEEDRLKAAEAKRLEEEQENIRKKEQEKDTSEIVTPMAKALLSLEKLEKHMRFKQAWLDNLQPLLDSKVDSQFRFACNKAVSTPINAINANSSAHLKDKVDRLKDLMSGNQVTVGDNQFSASSHYLGIEFCKQLIAKKFVGQASEVVSAAPEYAFSYAAAIVTLWANFEDFGQLFLAYLYEACPYLVPIVHEPAKPIDLKVITGYVRLYSAICISTLAKEVAEKDHPHGLGNIWTLLSGHLNSEPINGISATVLFDVLTVCGHSMMEKYGKYFKAMLFAITEHYFEKIQSVTKDGQGGPVSRLEELLKKAVTTGTIKKPSKLLPPGFF